MRTQHHRGERKEGPQPLPALLSRLTHAPAALGRSGRACCARGMPAASPGSPVTLRVRLCAAWDELTPLRCTAACSLTESVGREVFGVYFYAQYAA